MSRFKNMEKSSYGNYDGSAPHKVFAGEQQHARKCEVNALRQKVDTLEQQIARDYPIDCKGCPPAGQQVKCEDAADPAYCKKMQFECVKHCS